MTSFGQGTSTPLLSIKQSLEVYKEIHAPKPDFGMDIHSSEFKLKDVLLLVNNGITGKGVPIRCDHFVIILCLKGIGYKQINQHEFTIKPKTLHILSPGQIQSFKNTSCDFKFYVLLFEKSFISKFNLPSPILEDLLDIDPDIVPNFELSENLFKQVLTIFDQLNIELRQSQNYHEAIVKMLINQLLYMIKRVTSNQNNVALRTYSRADEIVKKFRKLIELHFQKIQSVRGYAELLHLTPKHLSHTIKSQTGHTALHFVHERILHEAEFLLVYSEFSIKQIAGILNFEAPSHFSRFFEEKTKSSPRQYRKSYK